MTIEREPRVPAGATPGDLAEQDLGRLPVLPAAHSAHKPRRRGEPRGAAEPPADLPRDDRQVLERLAPVVLPRAARGLRPCGLHPELLARAGADELERALSRVAQDEFETAAVRAALDELRRHARRIVAYVRADGRAFCAQLHEAFERGRARDFLALPPEGVPPFESERERAQFLAALLPADDAPGRTLEPLSPPSREPPARARPHQVIDVARRLGTRARRLVAGGARSDEPPSVREELLAHALLHRVTVCLHHLDHHEVKDGAAALDELWRALARLRRFLGPR